MRPVKTLALTRLFLYYPYAIDLHFPNPRSPDMRYLDVQKQLENDLQHYSDHQLLPSERNLSEKYQCSRETLRKALENLRTEGKIFKNKNIGWLINRHKIKYDLKSTLGFSDYTTQQGFAPTTQILSSTIIPATAQLLDIFGLDQENLQFIEIVRLRFIHDIPVLLEYNYLPYQQFANLLQYDLSQSIVHIVENDFAIHYSSSQISIKYSHISNEEKNHLLIPAHQSAVKIERISKSQDQVIEFDIEIWRDDKVELLLEIQN
jgi:GntR family transcriptional regulator